MKIFSNKEIRNLDQITIQTEPISSVNLMERVGRRIADWILQSIPDPKVAFHIFCGPGNNGGDGLVVARLLELQHRPVTVYVPLSSNLSEDAKTNLDRLPRRRYLKVVDLESNYQLPEDGILIDALFGSGLSRPLETPWSDLVNALNKSKLPILSIDIPSGMFADQITDGACIIASHTLALQSPKLAFYQRENAGKTGKIHMLDIGLSRSAMADLPAENHLICREDIASMIPARSTFDHKGIFGHALLICGGYGKVGAAILAARACLRVGAGKLTVHTPKYAYQVMQMGVPEAMTVIDDHDFWFTAAKDLNSYQTVGIGCGLGTHISTAEGLKSILDGEHPPLVMDADALNILSEHKAWLNLLAPNSILTPHPGEFKRLWGPSRNSFERLEHQRQLSVDYRIFIVYKQAYTCITTPDGYAYFNSTGNPGMATAGSGDVLTGMITGFLAQQMSPLASVLSAVYLHGLAGDLASLSVGQHSLIASDIIDHIGQAICRTTDLMHDQ
ncbi:MAG: NAD(P)H-hydrate dehydratase [Saprospiraceae bacterium]|nr:NAD(P)H-hydrate dehydratase [Saprospiraceae bacterium]